jgi:hypothetical protein
MEKQAVAGQAVAGQAGQVVVVHADAAHFEMLQVVCGALLIMAGERILHSTP